MKAKYEVKGIKLAGGEETVRFEANIYKDGKKVGYSYNEGCGGPNGYQFMNTQEENAFENFIEEWRKAKLATCMPQDKILYEVEASDSWVNEWLDKKAAEQDKKKFEAKLRKMAKTKTLFRLKTDPEQSWRTFSVPYSPAVQRAIDEKYGDQVAEIYGVNRKPEEKTK